MTGPAEEVTTRDEDLEKSDASSPTSDLTEVAQVAAAQADAEADARPGVSGREWLLAGLARQHAILEQAASHYRSLATEETLSHAAEWLLDNFHVAHQALRQIGKDMPPDYYRRLPVLMKGSLAGYPRVYSIAQRLLASTDARLDLAEARRFLLEYQERTSLTSGELWALPVMLRLILIDTLTRTLAALVDISHPRALPELPLVGPLTPDELVGNCFIGLRAISTADWQRFFESVSRVEAILRDDPSHIYARMDRETRNQYRTAVEKLAESTGSEEDVVASEAVRLARSLADPRDPREEISAPGETPVHSVEAPAWLCPPEQHVGFYLVDAGRRELERALGRTHGVRTSPARPAKRRTTLLYLGLVLAIAGLLVLGALVIGRAGGATPWQQLAVLLLSLVPALTIAVSLVDWIVTSVVPPRVLPKLDFDEGIPPVFRTLIAVPALLTSEDEVDSLLEQLEIYYLGNADPNLAFALLTDMPDAPEREMPEDMVLLERARAGIRSLNAKYDAAPFCLLHRERRWNPSEGFWMGWERKRGKLWELNGWLRGAQDTSFIATEGRLDRLEAVRYVITLDADTVLPRDAAQRLVATIGHPLNRAHVDPATGRVLRGYGILQPRTEITPTSANASYFGRVFAGDTGLDLYTRAVSNVYQDLFGTGIYVGKGIYDIDAFEKSLAGRVPENRLLSHDLFEGAHARAGLASDILLYEDFPPSYLAHIHRLGRWTRGDWQLLPWLLPWVPASDGRKVPNVFRLIDLWKLADNLRRSLLAPGLFLLLIAAWLWLPGPSWIWTLAAVLTPAIPALLSALTPFVAAGAVSRRAKAAQSLRDGALRGLLAIVFLPYEAQQLAIAIGRTLTRVLVTHRGMLEWATAAATGRRLSGLGGRGRVWLAMLFPVITAIALAVLIVVLRAESLLVALPVLAAWAISPEIAYRLSQPILEKKESLTPQQQRELQSLARRTWQFFERVVGPEDHWLPPDHLQEAPRGITAQYTSPTNIGMLLLSTVAAYDLGYIGFPILVTRLQYTFETLSQLERYRGHFLNWYDTRTLEPLLPRYVSTVDSGNLAAALIALHQAMAEIPHARVLRWVRWEALVNTYSLLDESIDRMRQGGLVAAASEVEGVLLGLQERILAVRDAPELWWTALEYAAGEGEQHLDDALGRVIDERGSELGAESLRHLRVAMETIRQQVFTLRRYVNLLLPWLQEFSNPPVEFTAENRPELQRVFGELTTTLGANPVLFEHPEVCRRGQEVLARLMHALQQADTEADATAEAMEWCERLGSKLAAAETQGEQFVHGLQELGAQADRLFMDMDFNFLYEPARHVFRIGYNVTAGKPDDNYYDLLASEARVASIVALAKRDAPRSHWLYLGRPVTLVNGRRALLSWSATMFEYLMPRLLLRSTPGTLLYESEVAAVEHQIEYARRKGVPWGISESGYYAFDASQNYQYRAFGVPGLGFKRDLAEDLVIAPYASLIALPVRPRSVAENVRRLIELGALGAHGLYEALDFTRARLTLGQDYAIAREYMAHHQGMILVALANYLLGDQAVHRFHADPRIRSVELLLQERIPLDVPVEMRQDDPDENRASRADHAQAQPSTALPWSVLDAGPTPEVHYLSNGRFSTLITAAGAGFSHWNGIDLTRWRADTTLEDWGAWIYAQDLDTGDLWSAARQPTGVEPVSQAVHFYPHAADFRRSDRGISLMLEVIIAPDADVEIRRLTIRNETERPRRLALTSYAELVMAPPGGDNRHPAFNKLFIESEYVPESGALLFRRRPRSAHESPVYVAHLVSGGNGPLPPVSFESDRAAFLGRYGRPRQPAALQPPESPLGGAVGTTLDPIAALQARVDLAPGATTEIAFLTAAAEGRAAALAAVTRFADPATIDNALAQAKVRAEVELAQYNLTTVELQRLQTLLAVLLHPHGGLRASDETLRANTKGQSGLWAYGISGDYPILIARVHSEEDLGVVNDLVQGHHYWRRRLLKIDLVILIDKEAGYSQELRDELNRLLVQLQADTQLNQRGGIFVLHTPQLPEADRSLLLAAARVIIDPANGPLSRHIDSLGRRPSYLPLLETEKSGGAGSGPLEPLPRPDNLLFDNGLGGFSPDGREYLIYLEPGQATPAPWVNVLANPDFGCVISESGSSCSWAVNSGENRLTPWSNDPVADPSGEILYLRDEETGEVWTPTPLPAGGAAPHLIRHGQGYTVFEHNSHGLRQHVKHFVAHQDPVKVIRLRLENTWPRPRRLTATFYVEWVLGVSREEMQQYVISEYDGDTQALLARNAYNAEFGERVAFVTVSKRLHGVTTDRAEFLGRLGDRALPAGLTRIGLNGGVTSGSDPCAALQVHVDLQPGESEEVWFALGQAASRTDAVSLAQRYKDPEQVAEAERETVAFWDDLLAAVQVATPDPAMDLLLNRWLPYQALACRIWGRAAFYQSSGAYGFRDQLQDVMALLHAAPEIARAQILRAAEHQFESGDVLHWWHPPSGRGVRTRCSDDLLWLPFVTAEYIAATGDLAILDETRPFLRAAPLAKDEEERYGEFPATPESYSLFEHCRRAIEKGSTAGAHGLPLMGAGDWNDGMNRVGIGGSGESVWLGWFLFATLTGFASVAEQRGDTATASSWRDRAAELKEALHAHAWDGDWYLRAFYDDGTPLGSAQNTECRIDAIAQSWAVLSGAGEPDRARLAMNAVREHLVRPDERIILLFTPPFDRTPRDPGYIKGYVPGIRENGGQYTHAAIWSVWAFAELGEDNRAMELFRLLNPIYHADSEEKAERYKVEPYVVAADVYGVQPHTGRGGWTWYTGSSGWLYRLGLEAILGVRRRGETLIFSPHVPSEWQEFELVYRYVTTTYKIRVKNGHSGRAAQPRVMLDGQDLEGLALPLARDGLVHEVEVYLVNQPEPSR